MAKAQTKYKDNFDKRVQTSKDMIAPGSFVFVRKEYYGQIDRKRKLAPIAQGLFRVTPVAEETVVIQTRDIQELLSQDRVVEASPAQEAMRPGVV